MDLKCFITVPSKVYPGVEFDIARMSFGRRLDLMTRVRALSQRREFAEAGPAATDRMESALLAIEIDRIYLEWGFVGLRGLTLAGEEMTPARLWESAPEALTREILAAIRAEAGLSEDERKN